MYGLRISYLKKHRLETQDKETKLFGNIFASPNNSGTRTVCIKILDKNSKEIKEIVQIKIQGGYKKFAFSSGDRTTLPMTLSDL